MPAPRSVPWSRSTDTVPGAVCRVRFKSGLPVVSVWHNSQKEGALYNEPLRHCRTLQSTAGRLVSVKIKNKIMPNASAPRINSMIATMINASVKTATDTDDNDHIERYQPENQVARGAGQPG